MTLVILDEAKVEINELVAWYNQRNPVAAQRLAELFEAAVRRITAGPRQFPLLEMHRNPGNVRRARIKGFPVYVGYQLVADDIYVFAVAHTSRRPSYWRSRLRK
jgi:toxin ParE1/3/4